jgi:hypothetical protein
LSLSLSLSLGIVKKIRSTMSVSCGFDVDDAGAIRLHKDDMADESQRYNEKCGVFGCFNVLKASHTVSPPLSSVHRIFLGFLRLILCFGCSVTMAWLVYSIADKKVVVW